MSQFGLPPTLLPASHYEIRAHDNALETHQMEVCPQPACVPARTSSARKRSLTLPRNIASDKSRPSSVSGSYLLPNCKLDTAGSSRTLPLRNILRDAVGDNTCSETPPRSEEKGSTEE